ncbi:hypothetical protein [Burkholderia ambifaria]|uniref:hypothetical protein n=1 Tax=Burkholderia ambifaria TaxID=152480 RepID=UPI001B9DE455|nr:hypothetical protein [Burkholderia ambifaria]MBR8224069.1 hypothetical protein [Burkholderia ambifaria]
MHIPGQTTPAAPATVKLYKVREAWRQAVERDQTELDKLAAAARSEDADFTALSQEQLESEVVAARKARARLHELMEKYRAAYAEDDVMRGEIRQDARDQVNRQLGRG